MINSRKTIAIFGCSYTSRYRLSLSQAFNQAAEEFGVNLIYINFLGNIGNKNGVSLVVEGFDFDLLEQIIYDQFSVSHKNNP